MTTRPINFTIPHSVESYRQLGFHIADDLCKKVTASGAKTLLEGVAKLEAYVAKVQHEAIIANQTRRNLPMTGRIRWILARTSKNSTERILPRPANAAGQDFETSVHETLRGIERPSPLAGHSIYAAYSAERSFETGDVAVSGKYKSAAECCVDVQIDVTAGEILPPCPVCSNRHPVTWTLL